MNKELQEIKTGIGTCQTFEMNLSRRITSFLLDFIGDNEYHIDNVQSDKFGDIECVFVKNGQIKISTPFFTHVPFDNLTFEEQVKIMNELVDKFGEPEPTKKTQTYRISFRSKVYIEAESLEQAEETWEKLTLFSDEAKEIYSADFVELESVEDADTCEDLTSQFKNIYMGEC